MSAVDKIIKVYDENVDDSEWVSEARAELAQLRADLQAAQERIAAQARQLEEARGLIIRSGRVINNLKNPDSVYDLTSDLLDWLAANRAALVAQLYDQWGGHYVVQRIEGGAYVDVRQLSRDEATTYRTRNDESLRLVWNQS